MITAAADGSSLANPGPAGWAWYIDEETWAAGGWPHGTNNQGELMAVLDLLRATAHVDDELLVLCDSQYVINSLTKWLPGWKRRGWLKADKKPVENRELMQQLDSALAGRRVRFEWVKAHAGHHLNEAADQRARAAATAYRDGTQPEHGPGFPGAAQPHTPSQAAPNRSQPELFATPSLFDEPEPPSPPRTASAATPETRGASSRGTGATSPKVVAESAWKGIGVDAALEPAAGASLGGMKPEHLELLVDLPALTLSPDGSSATYVTSRPSLASDSYVSRLWRVPTSGQEAPRPVTRGLSDSAPQYSPDGNWIAFLRAGANAKPQLALVEATGGEPWVLTDAPLGVSEFVWSADSQCLAFTARMPEPGRYGTCEGVSPDQEDPRWITSNKYQSNGIGYIQDCPRGIYLLRVPNAEQDPWIEPVGRAAKKSGAPAAEEATQVGGRLGGVKGLPSCPLLTPDQADCWEPELSPDGSYLYFTSALHEDRDQDLRHMIYRVPLTGGEPERVAGGPQDEFEYFGARFSRDATLFALRRELGPTGKDFVGKPTQVVACVGGEPQALTGTQLDYCSALSPYRDRAVMAQARVRGSRELHAIYPDARVEVLADGPRTITAAAERAGTLVAVSTTTSRPAELFRIEADSFHQLTEVSAGLLAEASPAESMELTVAGADGYQVHGWVHLPKGPGPHPLLLTIHGGPFSNYEHAFFDEAQVYTGAGYAVVQCNPRGSASYGVAHARAVKHRMGSVDMADVLAFLDGACHRIPALDANRVGIMGGSYGGYLTAWIISHEHRFRAAVVERGYLDPGSFVGTSDIGWFFTDEYLGADPQAVAAQSPFVRVDQVTTPTLVIHSEQDLRCPLEQAQRYFAALRRNGTKAAMLVFPGENHELSRSGSPWHRTQRFQAILRWWAEHLPVDNEGES